MGDNEITTTVTISVCDQGHYGSTRCDNCEFKFSGAIPKICPSCARTIVDTKIAGDYGGSDF